MRYPLSSTTASAVSSSTTTSGSINRSTSTRLSKSTSPSLLYKTSSLMRASSISSSLLIDPLSNSSSSSFTASKSSSSFSLLARIRIARDSIFLRESHNWLYASCESIAQETYENITEKIQNNIYKTHDEFILDITNFESELKTLNLPINLYQKIKNVIIESITTFNKSVESNQSINKAQDSLFSNVFTKFITRSIRCSKVPGVNMKLFESVFYHGALQGAMIAGHNGKNSENIWKLNKKSPEFKTKNGSNEKKRSYNELNDIQDPTFIKHKLRKQDEYETNGKSKIRKQNEYLNPVTQRNINRYKDEIIDEKISSGRSRGRTKPSKDLNDSDTEAEPNKLTTKSAQKSPKFAQKSLRERKTEKYDKAIQDLNDDVSDDDQREQVKPKTINIRQKPVPVNINYVGVKQADIDPKCWQAYIKVPTGKKVVVIVFPDLHATAFDAAKAHDFALIRALGACEASQLSEEKSDNDKLNFPINDYALENIEDFSKYDNTIKSKTFGSGFKGPYVPNFAFLMVKKSTSKTNSNNANNNNNNNNVNNKIKLDEVNNKGIKKGRSQIPVINSAPAKTIPKEEADRVGSLVKLSEVANDYTRNGIILKTDNILIDQYIIAFESSLERIRGKFQYDNISKLHCGFDLIDEKDYSEEDFMLLKDYQNGKFNKYLKIISNNKSLGYVAILDNEMTKKSEKEKDIKKFNMKATPISIPQKNEKSEAVLKSKDTTNNVKINSNPNLYLPNEIWSMCTDIAVNLAVIIGEELSLIKNKIQGSLKEYPNVVSNWEKSFKSRALKACNDDSIKNLRMQLEEVAMSDVFKPIFNVELHGLVRNEGGFAIVFEPEKNIASIKFFENDFSAAIVREQILDHLEWTTNNEKDSIIDYSQSNFTNDEWEYLKKMKDMIVEFGKIYK